MLKFRKKRYKGFTIIHGFMNQYGNKSQDICAIEIVEKKDYNYIENIFIDIDYRNRGYLRPIIDYLRSIYGKLVCLPLPQHVEKFKHLGFTFYGQKGDDIYYSLG